MQLPHALRGSDTALPSGLSLQGWHLGLPKKCKTGLLEPVACDHNGGRTNQALCILPALHAGSLQKSGVTPMHAAGATLFF